jgi:hypothetical protein
MKRQRKQSTRTKVQSKPNRRFQRFSRAAMIGIPPLAAVGSGIVTGYMLDRYKKGLNETIKKFDDLNDFIEETYAKIEAKKTIDKSNSAEFIRLFQETGHDDCGHLTKAIKDWEKMKANHKKGSYYSTDEMIGEIQTIEEYFHLYVIADSAIGLVVGFLLIKAAKNRLERFSKRKRERLKMQEMRDRNKEWERKSEEQRQRQLENSGTNWAQNGNGEKKPPLKPTDSSEIHLERLEGRKELINKLEKAIRSVCGRRCSGQVALSLVSLFSDNKIESLIDCPNKLAGFLINYKLRINEKLDRYGWSTEEVLIQIQSKSEKR